VEAEAAPTEALRQVAATFGTPTYAYDLARLSRQVERLRVHIPPAVQILYSLKANPSLGLAGWLAERGFGAEVASIGELLTALEAGFQPEQILVGGPYKSPPVLARIGNLPGILLAIDSIDELRLLATGPHRALLRLRPDFPITAAVAMGHSSRFGVSLEEVVSAGGLDNDIARNLVGFQVYCGSQVLDTAVAIRHLRSSLELALRAAERLKIEPAILDLGGGWGVPYSSDDRELDLAALGAELAALSSSLGPATIVLELGRYLVAQAGWYLTSVVAHQVHEGRAAVVVDGGVHQHADLCGLALRRRRLPPLVLEPRDPAAAPTDVLGCLCLPNDVLVEVCQLPALALGDILAFPNAGAYGLTASPVGFLGHPAPAEIAFGNGAPSALRRRQSASSALVGQLPLANHDNACPPANRRDSRRAVSRGPFPGSDSDDRRASSTRA